MSSSDDYKIGLVRWLLANYAALEMGTLPQDESNYIEYWGPRIIGRGRAQAPYELPICMKADIDKAAQQLSALEKFVILAVSIDGRRLEDCAYWLGKDIGQVQAIEIQAIRKMARMLSGKGGRGGIRLGAGRKSKRKNKSKRNRRIRS